MSYQRIDRISEQLRREVDAIIREGVSDPRVKGTYSVTRADVARDLRYAKVYVSVLEPENREPLLAALKNAAGFIRHELRARMIIRYAPELTFVPDDNIAYGVHIASVLKQVQAEEQTHDDATE